MVGMEKTVTGLQKKVNEYYDTRSERLWGQIYLELQPKLLYYLRNYIGDNDTREELVSRAFVKIWERRDTYNPEYAFTTWAFTIVLNETRIYWRETRDTETMEIFDETVIDPSDDYQEEYEDGLYERVVSQIFQLTEPHLTIMKMRYLDKLTYEQISGELGMNLNTVKTRIKRGNEKIRSMF